jgi:hypothetical protein
MMTDMGFITLTIINILAAVIIFVGALSERMRLYPSWHKVGLITAGLGLVFQAGRNVQFLATGISPTDIDLPVWVLKDIGIALIAFYYAHHAWTQHKLTNQAFPTKKQRKGRK